MSWILRHWTVLTGLITITVFIEKAQVLVVKPGAWGQWSGGCTEKCGPSKAFRVRLGTGCKYLEVCKTREIVECNRSKCEFDGGWSVWSPWRTPECSNTCGNITLSVVRYRACNNPPTGDNGHYCFGAHFEEKALYCIKPPCPINGQWSLWNTWNAMCPPVTCGELPGVAFRIRRCNKPIPRYGGENCSGTNMETGYNRCNLKECAVDGGFTDWSTWSETYCNFTACGKNIKGESFRVRYCTKPEPQHGGENCAGESLERRSKMCIFPSCRVNGGWNEWTEWSEYCGQTCGNMTALGERVRKCDNPAPIYGGMFCSGAVQETKTENCAFKRPVCPVHGDWSFWSEWSDVCTITCGPVNATTKRTRLCNDPLSGANGKYCIGPREEEDLRPCQRVYCELIPGWASWTDWDMQCNNTCGLETEDVHRTRQCISTLLEYGTDCYGLNEESRDAKCSRPDCPVDGGWSEWTSWTIVCREMCGEEIVAAKRYRNCSSPVPSDGGFKCRGPVEQEMLHACDIPNCLAMAQKLVPIVSSISGILVIVACSFGGLYMMKKRAENVERENEEANICSGPRQVSIGRSSRGSRLSSTTSGATYNVGGGAGILYRPPVR